MVKARLYIDGTMTLWALVQCDVCRDVYKYSALEAAQSPVPCTNCMHVMDVRQPLRDAAAEWSNSDNLRADATRELLSQLPPLGSPAASPGV
jgi:hypothetical protein